MNDCFDLVIFDCDGVLVDSERVANQVFAQVLLDVCDLEFTLEDMLDTFVGHSKAQWLGTTRRWDAWWPRPPRWTGTN